MKIKVLIVDDDRIELAQFQESVDWDYLECDIVATTFNGNIAYDLYKKLHPDYNRY